MNQTLALKDAIAYPKVLFDYKRWSNLKANSRLSKHAFPFPATSFKEIKSSIKDDSNLFSFYIYNFEINKNGCPFPKNRLQLNFLVYYA